MAICFQCKTEHDDEHYQRVVHNKTALYGPFSGWRMAGRVLVSPDGDRISAERLRGLLWQQRSTGIGRKKSAAKNQPCPILDLGKFLTRREAPP